MFQPAPLVPVKAGQFQIDHRHHAFKLKLRALDQIEGSYFLDQFVTQWQQHGRIARGVLQLRFRKFEFPVAQALSLIDFFVEIARGNRIQPVTCFDVAGGNDLAGEQGIEQPAEIDPEIVFDEFGIELGVVRDLDWPRRGQQLTQRLEGFAF